MSRWQRPFLAVVIAGAIAVVVNAFLAPAIENDSYQERNFYAAFASVGSAFKSAELAILSAYLAFNRQRLAIRLLTGGLVFAITSSSLLFGYAWLVDRLGCCPYVQPFDWSIASVWGWNLVAVVVGNWSVFAAFRVFCRMSIQPMLLGDTLSPSAANEPLHKPFRWSILDLLTTTTIFAVLLGAMRLAPFELGHLLVGLAIGVVGALVTACLAFFLLVLKPEANFERQLRTTKILATFLVVLFFTSGADGGWFMTIPLFLVSYSVAIVASLALAHWAGWRIALAGDADTIPLVNGRESVATSNEQRLRP